jgi:hypothetical protein
MDLGPGGMLDGAETLVITTIGARGRAAAVETAPRWTIISVIVNAQAGKQKDGVFSECFLNSRSYHARN